MTSESQLRFSSKIREEAGQALVEYALILTFVAAVCVGALQLVGVNVNNALNAIAGL